ncbi:MULTISPECIES: phosphate signaling complex protein PhoU [Pontibacillus]|uniref:Phosphate-specific transport system accessory protein PhoU n=1 Tax=Pontibacillus chungwhensis TaxID=265426 RepID=A0ABY8UU42_9BACI|nr:MULTISPECIES: phosphate signaling complex protein PhoU [Pontibacillus]MCD5323579.1 phosphate signaling complex protein PhoU [Pontibacillus sp. HN14]WIF96948.1 phosphate signaling complex protein PhoU [Pontibacillus chungwhensis]
MIRGQFHEDMDQLKYSIKKLAVGTVQAFEEALDALYNQDIDKAKKIIEEDDQLDRKELEINEQAILLIAKQQPVATDLRRMIVAIKVSSDLERMADHAVNVSKSAIHLGEDHDITIPPALRDMFGVAKEMVDTATKAFENEDISLARVLAEMDDKVDEMYGQITREMLELTANNPQKIQHIMQMAYVARYIERFADHITNIGEYIFYLVKGQTFDLNE